MKNRLYVGAIASAFIAVMALTGVAQWQGKPAKASGPDPLLALVSVNSDKIVAKGVERIRLMLIARSQTGKVLPHVKIFLRINSHGYGFFVNPARKMAAGESFVRSSSDHSKWIWSLKNAPAGFSLPPALLPVQLFISPMKRQSLGLTVWGQLANGKLTRRQHIDIIEE